MPATGPSSTPDVGTVTSERPVRVAVLDTGMAGDGYRPTALDAIAPSREHWEEPDVDGDTYLDPAAGHGTFIAGLIGLLAPGCHITVEKVLSSYGEGDEVTIARRVHALAGEVDIINLSFGGYAMGTMQVLAAAVRRAKAVGTVIVASAGNDAHLSPDVSGRAARCRQRRRHRPGGTSAVHQLRAVGAGLRAGCRHRELVLLRVRRSRPARSRDRSTPTTSRTGPGGAAHRSPRRPSWRPWPARWPCSRSTLPERSSAGRRRSRSTADPRPGHGGERGLTAHRASERQSVGGSPNTGNSSGPNVVISAMAPPARRSTSNLNGRNCVSPSRLR